MRALFESRNLVGDSLCISAALRAWYKAHREFAVEFPYSAGADWEIDLLTNNDAVAELYRGMGVPLQVIFDPKLPTKELQDLQRGMKRLEDGLSCSAEDFATRTTYLLRPEFVTHYDFEFTFDVSKAFDICDKKKCHLAQGYADLLGVQIGNTAADLGPFYDPPIVAEDDEWVSRIPQDTILLAPFSRSCSSHTSGKPNKCLPWAKWKPMLRFFRSTGHPIRVTGSADERADELAFSEEEYVTGMPLRALARAMKEGRIYLCASVDNGISHLAGSQKIPQILYYPLCLGLHYAVPWSNPYVLPIHMDPAMAEPAQLNWSTRQCYKMLEEMRKEGPEGVLTRERGL